VSLHFLAWPEPGDNVVVTARNKDKHLKTSTRHANQNTIDRAFSECLVNNKENNHVLVQEPKYTHAILSDSIHYKLVIIYHTSVHVPFPTITVIHKGFLQAVLSWGLKETSNLLLSYKCNCLHTADFCQRSLQLLRLPRPAAYWMAEYCAGSLTDISVSLDMLRERSKR